jgi:hypothetical protein
MEYGDKDSNLRLSVPFDKRIKQLSEQLANCQDEQESLELVRELQAVLHEMVEQLRTKASGLPLLNKHPTKTSLQS